MHLIASLPILLSLVPLGASHVIEETVHAVVLFNRHTDRTWKSAPPTALTILGQNDAFRSGGYWRQRYLSSSSPHQIAGISESTYNPAHLSASAPAEAVLVTTGQSFLQGLYPPVSAASEELANGTEIQAPLSGYQYVALESIQARSADSIWLKGDDFCPNFTKDQTKIASAASDSSIAAETKEFYENFYSRVFEGVLDKSKMSYSNAFAIYDYINIGMKHNKTVADAVSPEEFERLRYLASESEFSMTGDITKVDDIKAIGGRTFAGRVLQLLESHTATRGEKRKFTTLFGSYDTFFAFFAIANLPKVNPKFKSLPDLGSTMSFELVSKKLHNKVLPSTDELFVRFLFRNGTDPSSGAVPYPLFSTSKSDLSETLMPWNTFKENIMRAGIYTSYDWCEACGATESFCRSAQVSATSNELSAPVAGVIGAVIMLAIVSAIAVIALFLGVRTTRKQKWVPQGKSVDSGSISDA